MPPADFSGSFSALGWPTDAAATKGTELDAAAAKAATRCWESIPDSVLHAALHSTEPLVYVIDDFLSAEECEHLIALGKSACQAPHEDAATATGDGRE